MWINSNNDKIVYTGRIDWSIPTEPVWIFPCTSSEFNFTGNILKIHVSNKMIIGRIIWDVFLTMSSHALYKERRQDND